MSVKAMQKLNPPCKWLDEAGEVAADYTPHKQLYLKRVAQKSNGQLSTVSDGKVFIGDDVHIKSDFEGEIEFFHAKYHDSKLSDTAPWTPNQRSELIDLFKNDSQLEYVEFEIRTSDDFLQQSPYKNGMKVRIYRDDIYKSFKQGEAQVTQKVVL